MHCGACSAERELDKHSNMIKIHYLTVCMFALIQPVNLQQPGKHSLLFL